MSQLIVVNAAPSGSVVTVKSAPTGALQQYITPVTLRNTIDIDSRRLDQLLDVVADNANTPAGSTLVYDPSTDKYVVKVLDLDGGTF